MRTFFVESEWVLAGVAAAFVLGVLLSTKIKDLIKGIPSDARAVLTQVEVAFRAKLETHPSAAAAPVIVTVTPVPGTTGPAI